MRNVVSCLLASPSTHSPKKWLVTGLFGLLAFGVVISSRATVKKPDSSSPVAAKKAKSKKASSKTVTKQPTHHEWQKKQPFTSITHDVKKQDPAKAPAGQAKHHRYDDKVLSKYTLHSGSAGINGRNANPVSPVFTQRENSLPHAFSSRKTSVISGESKESGTNGTDSLLYSPGSTRFMMNYEKSADTVSKVSRLMSGKTTPDMATNNDIVETRQNQPNIQLGMEYATGNGRVNASLNYVKLKDMKGANSVASGGTGSNDSTDLKTFAIGYTYDVSSRTSFYGMVAHTDYEKDAMAGYMRGNGSNEDSVTGVQFGMTHKF